MIGWNSKFSLNVAAVRYIRESIANTATNMSKFTMAGSAPRVVAIMLPTSAITITVQKNYTKSVGAFTSFRSNSGASYLEAS